MTDFVVVGGGLIGLMLARQLAQKGASVILFERQELGRESSWAGGGILSPLFPWRYPDELTQLVDWRCGNFQQLANELYHETGLDIELNRCGLHILNASDEALALNWARENPEGRKSGLVKSDPSDLLKNERLLKSNIDLHSVLTLPGVGNVRNPRLLKALISSVQNSTSITLKSHCAVERLIVEGQRVIGVSTEQGDFYANKTFITAGAWSAPLLQALQVSLPVGPVKGQMLLIKARPGLLNSVLLTEDCYLIPRKDGRILVGSTLENAGFDKTPTATAKAALLAAAYRWAPALQQFPIEQQWAGLRPSSPQGIPFIGPVSGWQGIFLCTGHFRNGVVTAPASLAKILAVLTLDAMR